MDSESLAPFDHLSPLGLWSNIVMRRNAHSLSIFENSSDILFDDGSWLNGILAIYNLHQISNLKRGPQPQKHNVVLLVWIQISMLSNLNRCSSFQFQVYAECNNIDRLLPCCWTNMRGPRKLMMECVSNKICLVPQSGRERGGFEILWNFST